MVHTIKHLQHFSLNSKGSWFTQSNTFSISVYKQGIMIRTIKHLQHFSLNSKGSWFAQSNTFSISVYKQGIMIRIIKHLQHFSLNSKSSWFAQSNTFTKSQEIPEMYIFFFHALKIEFVNLYRALSVDKPLWNSYCWGTHTWWARKCLKLSISKYLENPLRREIGL